MISNKVERSYIDITDSYLIDTIKGLIKEQEEKVEKKRNENFEAKRDKRTGFLDKKVNDRDLKALTEKLADLEKLDRNLYDMIYLYNGAYQLPDSIDQNLDSLAAYLTSEEIEVLTNAINHCVRDTAHKPHDKIQGLHEEAIELAEKLKIEKNHVHDELGHFGENKKTIEQTINARYSEALARITPNYSVIIKPDENEILSGDYTKDIEFLNEIERLSREGKIDVKDKSVKKVVDNLPALKQFTELKYKGEEVKTKINRLKSDFDVAEKEDKNIHDVDFSEVAQFLDELEKKSIRDVESAEKYLAKFDLKELEEKIAKIQEKESAEKEIQNRIDYHTKLAYELYRTEAEEPENQEKIKQLREELVAHGYKMSPDQQQKAVSEAQQKYSRYETDKQMQKQIKQERYEKERMELYGKKKDEPIINTNEQEENETPPVFNPNEMNYAELDGVEINEKGEIIREGRQDQLSNSGKEEITAIATRQKEGKFKQFVQKIKMALSKNKNKEQEQDNNRE
ncbi:MAG: hypothetical protein IJH76_00405 [Clostridia bacterium]|nr:hypothetical protein [Clostridia bacterium]